MTIAIDNTPTITAHADAMPEPHLQRGCKITAGAWARLPAPEWRLAKMLVLARRASSRILKDPAATKIQRSFNVFKAKKAAAVQLQAGARRRLAVARRTAAATATIRLQSAARRRQAVLSASQRAARILPPVILIQAYLRRLRAKNNLGRQLAATEKVQTAWRMVASRVIGGRLARAAARLHAGATLSKYRGAGGLTRERHERRVWLSPDNQSLCWGERGQTIAMASVTAVTSGVKTELMKRMDARANGPPSQLQRLATALHLASDTLPLDEACAVSVIARDKVLDFVAPSPAEARAWLRDLRTILLFAHHLDHKRAVSALGRRSLADAE